MSPGNGNRCQLRYSHEPPTVDCVSSQNPKCAGVLIIHPDEKFRASVARVLSSHNYSVLEAQDACAALSLVRSAKVQVVLVGREVRGSYESKLVAVLRTSFPRLPIATINCDPSPDTEDEEAQVAGGGPLRKPVSAQMLFSALEEALQVAGAKQSSGAAVIGGIELEDLVGSSPAILRLLATIPRIAASSAPALIYGESGVGKELVSRALHRASGRGAFVPVNCGALPDHLIESELFGHTRGAFTGAHDRKVGLFQAAEGGTLFLDEIGELPMSLQPKLLRALDTGEVRPLGAVKSHSVNARVIAATHQDLAEAVRVGKFREDLYWRLHVLCLQVPPLRECAGDIPLLANHFLLRLATARGEAPKRIAAPALRALMQHSWPGNVRQLQGVIEYAVAFADSEEIQLRNLPPELQPGGTRSATLVAGAAERGLSLADLEREYILEVLQRTGGNRSRAAAQLGIPRRTLYRRLKSY